MENQTFTVVLTKEDDMYVAECPEVGTVSQGVTIDEAVHNVKEATQLYLEDFPLQKQENRARPLVTFFEVTSNASLA